MAEKKKSTGESGKNGNRGALASSPARHPVSSIAPLNRLRTEFDRLFDDFIRGWPSPWTMWGGEREWTPDLDVLERDDKIVIRADVPGFEPADIDVEVRGDNLVVCACQSEESKGEPEGEFHWKKQEFYRSVPLPADVDAEHVDASYRNGVLTISLPKTEQAKAKKIEVKS